MFYIEQCAFLASSNSTLASEQQNQSRGQYPAEHKVWRMQKARWPQLNGNYQYVWIGLESANYVFEFGAKTVSKAQNIAPNFHDKTRQMKTRRQTSKYEYVFP